MIWDYIFEITSFHIAIMGELKSIGLFSLGRVGEVSINLSDTCPLVGTTARFSDEINTSRDL